MRSRGIHGLDHVHRVPLLEPGGSVIISGPNETSQKASISGPNENNDPDWVSNGKQTARKCFQEDQKIKRAHRLTSLHTIHRDGTKNTESGQTLQGSFSAVSTPISASKYALESSRRDLHNALLCTVLNAQNFRQKSLKFLLIFSQNFANFDNFC